MIYPTNYDFGANWKSKIVPHLDDPRIQKSLQIGIDHYLSGFPSNEKYKENTCPANYSSNDCYAMLMDKKGEIYLDSLAKEGKLPKEYINLKTKLDNEDDDLDLLFEMEEEIKSPLYEWQNIKYDLESYYLSGSCYSYAPTFELTLARIVEPEEKWLVRTSDKHSTVINDKNTKVFDLLYWACYGDINEYMFGNKVETPDDTLGGKDAYLDTSDKSSMDLIPLDEFGRIMTISDSFKIKILDDPIIACYPGNVIISLKGKNGDRYFVEVHYDQLTNKVSAPIY